MKICNLSDNTKYFSKWVFQCMEIYGNVSMNSHFHHQLALVDLIFTHLVIVIDRLLGKKRHWDRLFTSVSILTFQCQWMLTLSFGDLSMPIILPPGFAPAQPFPGLGRADPIRGLLKNQPFQGNPMVSWKLMSRAGLEWTIWSSILIKWFKLFLFS